MFSNSSIRILQNSSADCNKKSDGSGFWVLGFKGSKFRGSGFWVQRFRSSKVQRFRGSKVQRRRRPKKRPVKSKKKL
jgi:hypothetical protein